jgi:SAM-dependent methyltransferase
MFQSTLIQIQIVILVLLMIPTLYAMLDGAPFVPTEMEQVNRMLKAANLKPGMKVYDLGSGDGRLVYKASKDYGAKGVGYEFSPLVWALSKFLSLFWRSEAKLKFGNFWKKDLSDADVIFCYLLTHSMVRMQKIIWPTLKPGTLVVSNAFVMKDLKPWKKIPRDADRKLGPIWIYKKEAPKKRVKTK